MRRYLNAPRLLQEWEEKEAFILQPEMLSPEKLRLEINPYENQPFICGPVFNAALLCYHHHILWLPAIVGCPLRVNPAGRSMWPEPIFNDNWYTKEELDIPVNERWLEKMLEVTRYLVNHADGRYVVAQDEIARGPGDLLANLLGFQNMLLGMYDYPGKIKELLSGLTEIWIMWAKAHFSVVPQFHGGYCNLYGLWAPGTSVKLQEDYAVSLSPNLYREFILPCNRKIIEAFEYQYFHIHSGFTPIAEWILEIEALKAIEVTIDFMGPSIEELMPFCKRIQKSKCLIICGIVTQHQLDLMLSELSPTGLLLDVYVVEEDQLETLQRTLT